MEVFRRLDAVAPLPRSVLTSGSFDGLHRGHQEIVKKVVTMAQSNGVPSVVVTFNPHPRHVLNHPQTKLPILIGLDKKLELFADLGVERVLVIPFTRTFSRTTAADFMHHIIQPLFHPLHMVVGYDHHFGYRREGTPDSILKYANPHHTAVTVVPPVADEDVLISSTHIRHLLQSGFVRRASFELGWVYGFQARIVHGQGRGRSLTFPTANFVPVEKHQLIPKSGVYLTRGRLNGFNLYGMCNLGVRPTFGESSFTMEVHFFQEAMDDLYSRRITIEFLERIRDEVRFETPRALVKQLHQDKAYCLELMRKYQ